MNKDMMSKSFIFYISLISFLLLLATGLSTLSLTAQIKTEFSGGRKQQSHSAQRNEETKNVALEIGETSPGPPLYSEIQLTSVVGKIFVNPDYTGKISNVRTLLKSGLSKGNPDIEISKSSDGWEQIIVHESEFDAYGLIATGVKGTLKITKQETPSVFDKFQSLNELTIGFGELKTTFLAPMTISQPSTFGIEILDYKGSQFVGGDIIAVKDNEIAVKFENLPPSVVSREGTIRVSLVESADRFLNADLKTWGYNLLVPETDTGKESLIKAEIFGLPKEAKVKFTFEPLSRQEIIPITKTLTVEEINSGKPLATLVTSIPGAQPLSVSVERMNR